MSVTLTPNSALGFNRPLTQLVKRTLTINNPNVEPIAFKVKTTAPKLYCVRPNSGRIEPGHNIEVSVMLQAMKEEPPINAKCRDKFLIQSTLITPEKENLPLQDIWNIPVGSEGSAVHQQKIRVVFLPAEGQGILEEDEGQPGMSVLTEHGDSRYETVRQAPTTNGHVDHIPDFLTGEPQILVAPPTEDLEHPLTPPADFAAARSTPLYDPMPLPEHPPANLLDTDNEISYPAAPIVPVVSAVPVPEPSREVDAPVVAPVRSQPSPPRPLPTAPQPAQDLLQSAEHQELLAKYIESQREIERLRALLASAPEPSVAPESLAAGSEFRRRRKGPLSDDGSTVAGTEVGTVYADDHVAQPDGVPLQVVVIIALGIFVTTYLFF